MNIGALWVTLGVDASNLRKAKQEMSDFASKIDSQVSGVQRSLKSMSTDLKRFGGDATRALTIPLSVAGGGMLNAFKNYETSIAHIIGLTGTSAEQAAQWSEELKKMSVAVAKPPQELAEALYYIASSGVDASKAMSILQESAKASAAGLGSTQQVADLVTSALNAYADTNLTASNTVDILTAAVREGKIEATAFASHIGYVIPIASEMGLSFDQVAAAMAAMSTTGADASTAATQLRQLLSDILKPAMQSEGALRQFGLSGQELRETLAKDGLLAALSKVRDLMNRFGQDAVAKVFPEVRALTGVLMLMGQNSEHVAEIFQTVKNSSGDLNNALGAVQSTLGYKFDQALAQAKLSMIDFGQAMKGPLISILNAASTAIKAVSTWFTGLSESTQKWIVVLGSSLALMGPVVYLFGTLASVISGLAPIFAAVTSGIGIAIGAVAALAYGIAKMIPYFTDAINKQTEFDRRLNETAKVTSKNIAMIQSETGTLYGLFEALKTANAGTEVRKNLISVINSKYGSYLPKLLDEKTTLADINAIENDLIKSMQTRMAMQMQESQITEILTQQIERNKKMLKSSITEAAPMSSWIAAYNDYIKTAGTLTYDFSKGVDSISFKAVSDEVNALATATGRPLNEIMDLFAEMSKYQKDDEKVIKSITDQYRGYISAVTMATKANVDFSSTNGAGGPKGGGIDVAKLTANHKLVLDEYENFIKNMNIKQEEVIHVQDRMKDKSGKNISVFSGTVTLPDIDTGPIDDFRMHFLKLSDIGSPMENIRVKLADLALQNKVFGGSVNDTGLQISYLTQRMQALWDQGVRPGAGGELDALIQAFNELGEFTLPNVVKNMADVELRSATLSKALAYPGGRLNDLNQLASTTGEQIDILQSAFDNLWSQGVRPGNEDLDGILQRLAELNQLNDDTVAKVNNLNAVYSVLSSSIADVAVSFGEMLGGAQKGWMTLVDVVLKAGQQIITTLLSMAIAGTLAHEMSTKGLIGLATAAVGIGLLMSLWEGYKARASEAAKSNTNKNNAAKMASGGIVPMGYPNDTYPAMLSSGEVVTPPGKLNGSLVGGANIVVKIEPEFFSGTDIHWIVKEVERRQKSAF